MPGWTAQVGVRPARKGLRRCLFKLSVFKAVNSIKFEARLAPSCRRGERRDRFAAQACARNPITSSGRIGGYQKPDPASILNRRANADLSARDIMASASTCSCSPRQLPLPGRWDSPAVSRRGLLSAMWAFSVRVAGGRVEGWKGFVRGVESRIEPVRDSAAEGKSPGFIKVAVHIGAVRR